MAKELEFEDVGPYKRKDLYQAYARAEAVGDTDAMQDINEAIRNSFGTVPGHPGAHPMTEYSQDMPESMLGKVVRGVGVGANDLVQGVGNMLGVVGDKERRHYKDTHADLDATWPGWAGETAGQTALTAPVGGGAANAVKAVGGVAGRVLPTAVGSALGAVQGAANADPEDRTGQALVGAALPLALKGAGKVANGMVQQSPAAKTLIDSASKYGRDLFIPLSQAADKAGGVITKAAQSAYQGILPFTPFSKGALEGQSDKAAEDVFHTIVTNSMPKGAGTSTTYMRPNIGKTPQETAANVRQQFENEFDRTLGSYALRTDPAGTGRPFQDRALDEIQKRVPGLPPQMAQALAGEANGALAPLTYDAGNGVEAVSGKYLQRAITDLRLKLTRAGYAPEEVNATSSSLMNLVRDEIQENNTMANTLKGSAARDAAEAADNLGDYFHTAEQWHSNAEPWVRAVEASPQTRGMPSWSAIARAAPPGSDTQRLAQEAYSVFGEPSSSVNPESRHLMNTGINVGSTALAAGTGAVTGHLPLTLSMMAAGRPMASKGAQNYLMGQGGLQEAVRKWASTNPEDAAYAQAIANSAGVAGATE